MSAHDHAYAGRRPGLHSDLDITQLGPNGTTSPYDASLNATPIPLDAWNSYMFGGNELAYDPTSMLSNTQFGFPHQGDYAPTAGFNIKPVISSSPSSRPSESDGVSSISDHVQRDDWVQNLLEESLRDLIQVLDRSGRILYTSACREIIGYEREELTGRFISEFLHPEDCSIFVRELNDSASTGEPFRFFYRFKKRDGAYLIMEAYGRIHSMTRRRVGSNTAPAVHTVFSIIARPYPNSNARLLDSFLEHKMENEHLTRRIAELKQEEIDEQYFRGRDSQTPVDMHTSNPHFSYDSCFLAGSIIGSSAMLSSTTSETSTPNPAHQRIEEPQFGLSPQRTILRPSVSNGSSYIDDVELMTGLHYRAGERAHGISTGNPNGILAHSAAPISVPVDKQDRIAGAGDRKRKMKTAEEYSCTDCGTLSSPEWRKGPNGRKTLCNACGLRWAKQEKRMQKAAAANSIKQEH